MVTEDIGEKEGTESKSIVMPFSGSDYDVCLDWNGSVKSSPLLRFTTKCRLFALGENTNSGMVKS